MAKRTTKTKPAEMPRSDRLRVQNKVFQQMERRGGRREMKPTEWKINGELFLNCSCEVFCPCVVSLGKHPPTEGTCRAWMAIAIDDGHFEGEDISGLNIGLMVEIPGRMADGGWKVAAYVDERATQKGYNGILKILTGEAGGTTGLFTLLVSDIIGAERAPVDIVRDCKRRSITIGRKIQGEIEMLEGASPDHPVVMSNTKYWMGPDIIAAKGLRSRVRDYGRVWDFGGKSAEICPIAWGGPGK